MLVKIVFVKYVEDRCFERKKRQAKRLYLRNVGRIGILGKQFDGCGFFSGGTPRLSQMWRETAQTTGPMMCDMVSDSCQLGQFGHSSLEEMVRCVTAINPTNR